MLLTHEMSSNQSRMVWTVLGWIRGTNRAWAYLCEGNEVGTLYDTQHGVPLYSATVLDKDQLTRDKHKRNDKWHDAAGWQRRRLTDLWPKGVASVPLQYQSSTMAKRYNDNRWTEAAGEDKAGVDRGHLVASSYAKESINTFTMQNIVPQFKYANNGGWNVCESTF